MSDNDEKAFETVRRCLLKPYGRQTLQDFFEAYANTDIDSVRLNILEEACNFVCIQLNLARNSGVKDEKADALKKHMKTKHD